MQRTASRRARAWLATALLLAPALLALAPPVSATPSNGWSELYFLDPSGNSGCTRPAPAGDGHGTLFVAARCQMGTSTHVMATVRQAGGDWSLPLPIDLGGGNDPYEPVVDVGQDGTATVAWTATDTGDGLPHVYGAVYLPSTGWEPPARLDTGATSARYSLDDIVVSSFPGGAFVAWGEAISSNGSRAVAAIRQSGGTWDSPLRISEGGQGSTGVVYMGADGQGNAKAAFFSTGTGVTEIKWSQYTATGWSQPAVLVTDASLNVTNLRIGVGRSGAATVSFLWREYPNTVSTWEVHTTGTSSWSAPARLSLADGNNTATPRAFVDDADGFSWAWVQGPSNSVGVYASHGSASSPASAPEFIMGTSAPVTYLSELQGTADGRLLLAVTTSASPYYTWACTYTPVLGWDAPARITSAGSLYSINPPAAISKDGRTAMVAVMASDALYPVAAFSLYTWPDLTPPPLLITAPAPGDTTSEPSVLVEGTTEPGARADVAGVAAAVDSSGFFSVRVALVAGDNTIYVTAADAAGNEVADSVSVFFNDPTPALEAQLQEIAGQIDLYDYAMANLSENNSQLELQIAAKEEAIRELYAQQVAMGEQANATAGEFAGLQALYSQQSSDLNATRAQLDQLSAAVNASSGGGGGSGETNTASDPTALMLGALGAALGAGALVMTLLSRKRPPGE